ncbi:MAG: MFS transporter [Candidatus Aenigmatarchaeota archaeon]
MNKPEKVFWIFAFVTLFTMIADRLLFVLFPSYLIEKNFSAVEIGAIFSFAALLLILLRIAVGKLSDIYGRKVIMSFGLLINSISILFYPIISKLYEFAVVKGVQEISWTLKESVDDSIQADSFPKKSRANYLAKLGTIYPLGRAVSAIIGFLVLTYIPFIFGFYLAALCIFISFLIFSIFYKEELETKIKPIKTKFNPLMYSLNFNIIAFGGFIGSICFSIAYFPAFFILTEKYLLIKVNDLFLMLLISYIISMIFVYFTGKRIDNFGRSRTLLFGFLFLAITVLAYAFVQDIIQFIIVLVLVSLSYYIWRIALKTIIMDYATPKMGGGTAWIHQNPSRHR